MQNFTIRICYKRIQALALPLALLFLFSAHATAQLQSRPYTIAYSGNLQGTTTMFGNTLEAIYQSNNTTVNTTAMNSTNPSGGSTVGNNGSNMGYIDIDGDTSTRNSSSADLSLPLGTNNIKFARLYWGGRTLATDFDMTKTANQTIKLKFGANGNYFKYTADHIDDTMTTFNLGTSRNPNNVSYYDYQAYVDVTAFIQANGSGTYMAGNTAASIGVDQSSAGDGTGNGYYGGWCIVIAYENTTAYSSYNSVRIYDGYKNVSTTTPAVSITLTNLNVPSGTLGLRDATMGMLAWEGDAQYTGDGLKINGTSFSNAVNPSNNVFNGSITDTGNWVHSKNPDYYDEMAVDIDQFYVGTGYGIAAGAQNVTLAFSTNQDSYWPGVFTFSIKTTPPNPILVKKVTDANGNHIAEAGEVLTYDLLGQNTGAGNSNNTVISDTLPSTVTYVPGSLKTIYSPGQTAGSLTDQAGDDDGVYISNGSIKTVRFYVGSGATSSTGGLLTANDSFHYQFQVTVNTPAIGSVPPIVNIATVTAASDAGVRSIDFGTAIIDPQGGPLPVTLTSFSVSVNGDDAKINWTTSMENNCKEYYVERSTNGTTFNTVATVAGHGTTLIQNFYAATDDITDANSSVLYYRLAQVDADGKINYSRVVTVKLQNSSANNFTVSPNPFSSSLNVSLNWGTNEAGVVKVINMLGRVVASKSIQLNKGENYVSIDELSGLPSGNYLLQVNSADGSLVKEITKQ